jgi:hypothetical protein
MHGWSDVIKWCFDNSYDVTVSRIGATQICVQLHRGSQLPPNRHLWYEVKFDLHDDVAADVLSDIQAKWTKQ